MKKNTRFNYFWNWTGRNYACIAAMLAVAGIIFHFISFLEPDFPSTALAAPEKIMVAEDEEAHLRFLAEVTGLRARAVKSYNDSSMSLEKKLLFLELLLEMEATLEEVKRMDMKKIRFLEYKAQKLKKKVNAFFS